MTTTIQSTQERLQQFFKYLNRFMLLMWRLGFGSYMNRPELSGRIMVLTHNGRKTGLRRQTPVNFAIVDGEVYCVAGFGRGSDWYRNLLAEPRVDVWLPKGWWAGIAEDISDSPRRIQIIRQVMIASGFAARLAGIDPLRMSDEELADASASYPLVHIRRTEARTGLGGPGDLAWVWPWTTVILLILLLFRPRSRRSH
ncbi:MAG TPA: nitroreductase family deazaflavin-dependent oxidoreductase [Anaerolineales bacterium]|nr:nitroreductase family deazaflavin-dependent oxidoreductase [Anaerolineales bacterium]